MAREEVRCEVSVRESRVLVSGWLAGRAIGIGDGGVGRSEEIIWRMISISC